MTIPTFLFLLILLFALPIFVNSQKFSPSERAILLNLKKEWRHPRILQSWNASSSPCDWPEITCADGSVVQMVLKEYNIKGTIPGSISALKNLKVLHLSSNFFGGYFPTAIFNCWKLVELDLSQNDFVGNIPEDIGRLKSLRYLDHSANNFTGDIPPAIGNLKELTELNLYMNLFNGSYPKEMSNLQNLEYLRLAYNGFSPAPIPPELGQLRKLKYLWMKEMNVIGELPPSFANLTSLEHLDLSRNYMSGEIPDGLFLLKNLSFVYLYNNEFSGLIPQRIESLKLVELHLSMNNLTGKIPENVGKLENLQLLNLHTNNLVGEIPQSIGTIPNLKNFRVFRNNLSGILPPAMGNYSKLEDFEVSENHLTGSLPENLCAGQTLFELVAFANNLTGEIPGSLGNCPTLRTLRLYDNKFSGEIPPGLWTGRNMTSMMLSNNNFSGELPGEIAWNMTRSEINNNELSGRIPAEASSWGNLVVFEASNNSFTGPIPQSLTSLHQLIILSLDGNSLSGKLPSEIVSWASLNSLNLARNKLTGPIPTEFASLPDLLYLDLSENQLSGEIPPQLGKLKLTSLNLSSNRLSGKIPDEFDNMDYAKSFLNNSNLCATNAISNLRSCYPHFQRSKKLSPRILAVILVLAVLLLFISLVMTWYLVRNFKRKKLSCDASTWKLTSFHQLDFSEDDILANLQDSPIIGCGGSGKVYKISVDGRGRCVAVKKICNDKKVDHLDKQFLSEIHVLGSVRHSNIVKLLCCISSDDTKLLVYEYMENHSLDKWLHGRKRKSLAIQSNTRLDWPTRLRIAVGAANGLCHMHHDCTPPILHRDVKSSNILLDSHFNAKIADFGLAKILIKQGEPNTMSTFVGSFGYIAPEYANTGKVDEKIDVYGFGVVLLELVTGRKSICEDERTSLAEWAWKRRGEGLEMGDALDREIKEGGHLGEMIGVYKLGLMCTSPEPTSRPSMKEVVNTLLRCGNPGKRAGLEYDIAPLRRENYISTYRCNSMKPMDQSDNS